MSTSASPQPAPIQGPTPMTDWQHGLHTEAGYHELPLWLACATEVRGELPCHTPPSRHGHARRAQPLAARLPWALRPWHRVSPDER